jgi:hypothetical protein
MQQIRKDWGYRYGAIACMDVTPMLSDYISMPESYAFSIPNLAKCCISNLQLLFEILLKLSVFVRRAADEPL